MEAEEARLEATQPVAATGNGVAGERQLAVRWVFPAPRVSLLHEGHCLGRDPACDTLLPGNDVSRRHAQVLGVDGFRPVLRDLDSRNGMFVAGERVKEHALRPGDVVRIGEWVGVTVARPRTGMMPDATLKELAPGWFGGAAVEAALAPLRRVADSDLSVVIQGEAGTGKEGAAQALHRWSGRSGALIAVDCGALPEDMAEALLFGHKRGAFAGAEYDRPGYMRAADGGTLFLDDVQSLPLSVQGTLLRALETRSVVPLGESEPVPVDVRVVAAAQGPLGDAVSAGELRADLLARLDGVTVVLPALRQRRDEIVGLFGELFVRHGGRPSYEARFAEALSIYNWPLNVRELGLLAQQLALLHPREQLRRSFLPLRMQAPAAAHSEEEPPQTLIQTTETIPPPRAASALRKPVGDDSDFEALTLSLKEHQGNLTKAATALGMSRARAYRVLGAHPEFDVSTLRKDS